MNTHSEEYKLQCLERYKATRAELWKLFCQDSSGKTNRQQIESLMTGVSEMNRRTFRNLWKDWKSGKVTS